jgi:hypothetical protein
MRAYLRDIFAEAADQDFLFKDPARKVRVAETVVPGDQANDFCQRRLAGTVARRAVDRAGSFLRAILRSKGTALSLAACLGVSVDEADEAVREFEADLLAADRGIQLRRRAHGMRIEIKPSMPSYLECDADFPRNLRPRID